MSRSSYGQACPASIGRLVASAPVTRSVALAALHVAGSAWSLYFGLQRSPGALLWIGVAVVVGLTAFAAARASRPEPAS